jgi:hypothetical protein
MDPFLTRRRLRFQRDNIHRGMLAQAVIEAAPEERHANRFGKPRHAESFKLQNPFNVNS